MSGGISPLVLVLGFVAAAAVLLLIRMQFSADARLRRRRRRNYGPTVSKSKGPTVKLAVKAEETKH